ncbi:MAG TPA: nuclear transport factor 2 family protein [Solirubrobacteraceae bacterium]|nr:nuclear transport factor 2 family protein [Solirubrobacteraceae bacterium]
MALRRIAAAVALAALAATAAGCGQSEEEKVRDTLTRFEAATAKKDYAQLCDDLLARELVGRLRAVGLPCPQALQRALGAVIQPSVQVERVRVTGDTALARITTTAAGQEPSRDTMRLVRQDGDWRVSALSGNQPPSPPRNLAGEPQHGD